VGIYHISSIKYYYPNNSLLVGSNLFLWLWYNPSILYVFENIFPQYLLNCFSLTYCFCSLYLQIFLLLDLSSLTFLNYWQYFYVS
jgi:hypothetical protein